MVTYFQTLSFLSKAINLVFFCFSPPYNIHTIATEHIRRSSRKCCKTRWFLYLIESVSEKLCQFLSLIVWLGLEKVNRMVFVSPCNMKPQQETLRYFRLNLTKMISVQLIILGV